MNTINSPWQDTFERFARSIRRRAIVVAPFITAEPLRQFASSLDTSLRPEIRLLTNFDVDSLLQGSVDAGAIAEFCRATPATSVRHLPGLHAKAYVADCHTAIVTSGNLTSGSLRRNYEYGVYIDDSAMVRKIASDLQEYGNLGMSVSLDEIYRLGEVAESLRSQRDATLQSARASLRQQFENQLEETRESIRALRGESGESTQSIFSRTIIYVLRNGPMTTREIHPLIQNIHPDLCDDGVDRIIGGVHFGKEWKHRVRGAQQALKRQGLIENTPENRWRLTGAQPS